jgi:hypothetical protein
MTDRGLLHATPPPGHQTGNASHGAPSDARLDRAAVILLLFTGLNLNAVFNLIAQVQAQLSPLVLVLTCLLLLRYARRHVVGPLFLLFMVFFGSYLIFAILFSLMGEGNVDQFFLRLYAATPILVSALYFWLRSITANQFERALRLFKHLLIAACTFTLLSDLLQPLFNYVAPPERSSGVFENPDEAAVAALYGLVLAVAYPNRPIILAGQVCIAVAALVLTFSKAGFGMLLLLTAMILIRRGSILLIIAGGIAIVVALSGIWWAFQNGSITLSKCSASSAAKSTRRRRVGALWYGNSD